jgi:hypothetical protein
VRKVVKVIFHRSGTYPGKYALEEGKEGELKKGVFDGQENVNLWHKKSYNYIHFCAYTVDSTSIDRGQGQ